MSKKKHILTLTDLEILALIECLDNYSALVDGILYKKDLKKVDRMLNKNGYRRTYN